MNALKILSFIFVQFREIKLLRHLLEKLASSIMQQIENKYWINQFSILGKLNICCEEKQHINKSIQYVKTCFIHFRVVHLSVYPNIFMVLNFQKCVQIYFHTKIWRNVFPNCFLSYFNIKVETLQKCLFQKEIFDSHRCKHKYSQTIWFNYSHISYLSIILSYMNSYLLL